jgi:hypothetical protein
MTSGDRLPQDLLSLSLREVTQKIRDELKARYGLNRRKVAVRCYANAAGADRFHVYLLVPGVSVRKIERAISGFRYARGFGDPDLGIRRRIVHAELDRCVYYQPAQALCDRLWDLPPDGPNVFHPVRFGRYRFEISRESCEWEDRFRLRKHPSPRPWIIQGMAQHLARILMQSRQWRRLLTLASSKESL